MSGVARGNASTRWGRWWQNWRFHLSALAVIAPCIAFPAFLHQARMFTGEAGLGAREAGVLQAGPYALRLAEFNTFEPMDAGIAGPRKVFTLALCKGCEESIRAVHVRIGKPRSLRAAGSLFSGVPERLSADLPVPDSARPEDGLWVTVEEWDGSSHKAEMPLEQASPATFAWLARKQETTK
ncbi:thiamine pyrophosphate-binding protein [Paracoccus sp. KR1-242]|uniref:thiamine pyrophosphate-binding protein n=1 Tax=Paracoccus sp. KR1-242 TaxID=3410028 RepID=UPI003C0CDA00